MIATGTPYVHVPTSSWQEFMSRKENRTLTVQEARRKYLLELNEDFRNKLLTNFMYGTLNTAIAQATTATPGYSSPGIGVAAIGEDFIVG